MQKQDVKDKRRVYVSKISVSQKIIFADNSNISKVRKGAIMFDIKK